MLIALRALVFLGWLVWWGRAGYRRRRPHWTRTSWTRFSLVLLGTLALEAVALGMGYGVDHGVYHGMTPTQHQWYFYTLMSLGVLAPLMFASLVTWFALGRAERQFWSSRRRTSPAGRLTWR